MTINKREEFDRSREFVVFKPLTLGGRLLTRGQPFDKTKVNVRRLRQLFDNFDITFANGGAGSANGGLQKEQSQRREGVRSASLLEGDVAIYRKEQSNGKVEQEVPEVAQEDQQEGTQSSSQESQVDDKPKIKRGIPRVRVKTDQPGSE